MNGTVSWVNHKKGYGFIESDSKLYFFREEYQAWKRKSSVKFDFMDGEKGKTAINIEEINN